MKDSSIRTVSIEKIASDVDPSEEVRYLRQQLQAAQNRLDEYKLSQGKIQMFMRDLQKAITCLPPPSIQYNPPETSRVTNPIALVIHNTDWHMGAVQEEDEIEGFNAFSPTILEKRILLLVRKVLTWTQLHRNSYTVDECRILVTGDLISGDIHDELRVTNAFPTPVQTVEAGCLLAKEIALLSPHFPRVKVDFITVDNHSRLTPKPQHKQGGYNTFNYPLAYIAQQQLANHKNVTFHIHPKEQEVVNVKGRRYLLCHGHQVMGWAGFPYYGIQRKVGREAAKRMRSDIAKFDRIILGHWHAPLQHPWYWIGGSASGTDAYDHSQGRDAEPIQSAWFVHPRHGEFDRTDWVLHEKEKKEEER